MGLSREVSSWSKDNTKIGAVAIDDDRRVLSMGFNGFPKGINDTHDRLSDRPTKLKYVVHAEMNCIYNAGFNGVSLKNSTLFVYGLPTCSECAKGVIQSGIKRLFMCYPGEIEDGPWGISGTLGRDMLEEAGVKWEYIDEESFSSRYKPVGQGL